MEVIGVFNFYLFFFVFVIPVIVQQILMEINVFFEGFSRVFFFVILMII